MESSASFPLSPLGQLDLGMRSLPGPQGEPEKTRKPSEINGALHRPPSIYGEFNYTFGYWVRTAS